MVLQKFELSLEFLYVRITKGSDNGDSDNGDSDNRGCMVALFSTN